MHRSGDGATGHRGAVGGHLAYRLALEAPDLVRAVAAIGANLPTDAHLRCSPVPGATPVLVMNGTDDPINPYRGGEVTLFGFGNRGEVRSSAETAAYFASRIGASSPPEQDVLETGDGTRTVERTRRRSGRGEVAFKCRLPYSEPCVWGKAFLPLTASIYALVGIGVGAGIRRVRR